MRAASVATLLFLGACGRIGFDTQSASDAPIVSGDAPGDASPDGPGYRATAVRFETAGNDYIWTGFLANTTNSAQGTYSVWLHFNGGDDQLQFLSVAQVVGIGGVLRAANNHFQLVLPNCAAITVLDMQTENAYTSTSGWVHLLASWDLAAGRADLYVNDVADRAANPGMLPGNVCYASLKWGIGGLVTGALDADVADLYASLGTYVDLDVEANRRLFRDAAGKPVDLGADCSGPTGAAPTGCFVGDFESWNTNKGTGAGFVLEGDGLVVAPTSPSD